MKNITYQSDKNFIMASAHMVITRLGERGEELIAAGIIDVDSASRAIAARAMKGERLHIQPDRHSFKSEELRTFKNGYRFVSRPMGKLNHTILLHKSAVDPQLEAEQARTLIVPTGGNVADLFRKRFATDFNLPNVPEWSEAIWTTCQSRNLVQRLNVWTDPELEEWRGITAFEVHPNLTEEVAKEIVSDLLAAHRIELPEGITDAPALSETLQPDENGEYQVIDYLQTYAPHLATTIEELATPAHDLDRPIHPAIAQMTRVPFPAQAHTAQAILKGFEESKGIFLSSDMGSGKSIISMAVANALAQRKKGYFPTLLLVPGITIPKWQRDELGKTLPHAKTVVIDSWRDLVHYRDRIQSGKHPNGMEFVLLSRDTAKLGLPKAPALIYKDRVVYSDRSSGEPSKKPMLESTPQGVQYAPGDADKAKATYILHDAWVCPDCGGIQRTTDATKIKEAKEQATEFEQLMDLKLSFDDLAVDTHDYEAKRFDGVKRWCRQYLFKKTVNDYHCSECGANLMRDLVPEREKASGLKHRRLQPAWFIQKYLRGHFQLTIVDELHQYKSNSGQGEAMGAIVGASQKVIGLTGTLSDGKSSSLYHLLWRICPAEMKQDGLDHRSLSKFVHLYGAMEQKGRYGQDDVESAGGATSRKTILNPPKEIPGLSPKLFANHLANKTVFLELGDMGLPLVELEETPVFINMDEDHAMRYAEFHDNLETQMKISYMLGNKHAFAKFIPSVVNAANQPHKTQSVPLADDVVHFFGNAEDMVSIKEQRLIDDVKAEIAQNRRCVVYVRYSGESQQDKRLVQLLDSVGLRVRLLKASVSPEDRVEWLDQAVDDDIQVVVSNAKLVEVGLDLLSFPTLFFWQFTDEIATMRQASRRAWRIGQHRKCRVVYYVTNGTYEMTQFKRMLAKRAHALLLEGRADRSEVAQFMEQDDKSASTFAIANCLDNIEDLTKRWQALADRDIPTGVTMLAEETFKVEIGRAMQRLASETRRLAGVPEPLERPREAMETVELPIAHITAAGETAQLSLFDALEPAVEEPSASPTPEVEPMEADELMTVGNWRRQQMGLVTKAKRAKKTNTDADNQLMLFAL